MNDEANMIIAEALGWKPKTIKWCCETDDGLCHPDCGMTPDECKDAGCYYEEQEDPPDYCGNDHDAWGAIMALQAKGLVVYITMGIDPGEDICPCVIEICTWPDCHISLGDGDSLHAALKDAMVEQRLVPGVENIQSGGIRLRPAIEAALKGAKK